MAFFIALLEESGYMSRVIFLMDRIMRPFGFSGRAMMPLIGGMACAIPSIMATRTIPNRKERLITIMVTPLMSCSARIPVYILLIGLFIPATPVLGIFTLQGLAMMGLYVLGFAMALVAALVFKIFLKYQQDSIFVTELPIYRRPRWKNVALTVYQKCRTFVIEAGKIILVISVVLWFMAAFAPGNSHQAIDQQYDSLASQPGADQAQLSLDRTSAKLEASYVGVVGKAIEPAIRPMGFDWKIGISLITSFAAREVFVGTMATIYSAGDVEANPDGLRTRMLAERNPRTGKPVYTFAVACALLVFYAFAMQCMSTLAVTKRETGSWKWVIIMLVYLTALAYLAAWGTFAVLS
jgi:ferrous iron transport protein B